MKIFELATHKVVTISKEASIVEAAKLMREHHVGTVVIVDLVQSEQVPIGLVTDRDIVVDAVAQAADSITRIKVKDIAAKELVTADADTEAFDVMHMMIAARVRRIPIVNALGALVGIVTYDDLMCWVVEEAADFSQLFIRQRRRERSVRQ